MKNLRRAFWIVVAAAGVSLGPAFAQDGPPAGRWLGRSGGERGGETREAAREARAEGPRVVDDHTADPTEVRAGGLASGSEAVRPAR